MLGNVQQQLSRYGVLNQHGTRSSVLSILQWTLGGLLLFTVTSHGYGLHWGYTLAGAICVGVTLIMILGFFVYFAVTDKDALRSERFAITKMAIERGALGDDERGLYTVEDDGRLRPEAGNENGKEIVATIVGPPVDEERGATDE